MVFGTRGLCASSHQHPWQPLYVQKGIKYGAPSSCSVWRKLPRDSISRATWKGDADTPTDNRISKGGNETLLQSNAVQKQKPTSALSPSDDTEDSSSQATEREAAADSSTVKPASNSKVARPDAKQAAKHLLTFNKVAERAKARSRVRNGVQQDSKSAAFSEPVEDVDSSGVPRRSLSSSSLADVILSASSSARAAASKDVPDARTPQKLLSTLKNKKKPKSLQNSRISSLSSYDSSGNTSTSQAKQFKSPALARLQKRLAAGKLSAIEADTAPLSNIGPSSSSRWDQVSGVFATGGSTELAAAEGGATFVHKARERFMDVDGKTFWELIRSVVPQQEWTQTAKALARLQSISRVELSQQADFAATALELVNTAKVLPPEDTVDAESSAFSSADLGDGSGATAPSKPRNSGSSSSSSSESESENSTNTSAASEGSAVVSDSLDSASKARGESKQQEALEQTVDLNSRAYKGSGATESSVLSTVDLDDDVGPIPEALAPSLVPGVGAVRRAAPSGPSPLTGSQYLTGSVQNTSIDSPSFSSSPGNSTLRGASKGATTSPGTEADRLQGYTPYVTPDTDSLTAATTAVLRELPQSSRSGAAAPLGMRMGPGVVTAGPGPVGLPPRGGTVDSEVGSGAASQALFANNSKLVLQLQWFALRAHSGPLTHSEAMSLDHLLTQQLLELAGSAHFGGLKPRDVALAKSLNEDKLSQLFVKVDNSTLDARLVAPHTHADLPEEARSLMVLKRGTGRETSEGLLLVQKLDYLQLLLVEAVSDAVSNAWSSIAATAGRIMRAGADASAAAASEAARVAEETGVQYPSEPLVDTNAWGKLKGRGKDAIVAMREWGMSPRMIGGGLLLTLSDLGLGPKVDVIRLPRFDAVWPAPDKHPVRIRRVTLEDVFKRPAAASESLFKRLVKPATLEEPTFQELLVVYRRKTTAEPKWLAKYQDARIEWLKIVDKVLDNGARAQAAIEERAQKQHTAARREPVQLRVLSDIPMAYWQAVFPDKLMQFKPLDGLRLDFITVVGVVAVLAQIQVDSPVLQVVSLASLVVAVVRSVLGYQRMSIRYENFTNEMIASKTLAQEEAVIEFLARAAAQQRFASAALAYAVLVRRAHRARTNIAAVAAAEAAATVAADDAAASAARRAAEPLREQPWLARHMAQSGNKDSTISNGDSSEEGGEQSIGSSAGAALSALLDEGQKLLEAVRSVAGARRDSGGARSGTLRKRRGSWQGPGMTASELRLEVETMLNEKGLGHVRFDVNSALHELRRLQLLQTEDDAVRGWLRAAGIALAPHPELDQMEGSGRREKGLEGSRTRAFERRYVPVSSSSAEQALTEYWTMLLEGSVETSLAGIL